MSASSASPASSSARRVKTSRANPSPYDGALFARDILSIALRPLADDPAFAGVLAPEALAAALRHRPAPARHGITERADYADAWPRQLTALATAYDDLVRRRAAADPTILLGRRPRRVHRRQRRRLEPAGLYEVLSTAYMSNRTYPFYHGLRVSFDGAHWSTWPQDQRLWTSQTDAAAARRAGLRRTYARELEFLAFCQLLHARQHAGLRHELAARPASRPCGCSATSRSASPSPTPGP